MKMSRSASFFQKYWFARGYSDRLIYSSKEPPSIDMVEYVKELTNTNILNEYDQGYDQAEKDKVNNIVW